MASYGQSSASRLHSEERVEWQGRRSVRVCLAEVSAQQLCSLRELVDEQLRDLRELRLSRRKLDAPAPANLVAAATLRRSLLADRGFRTGEGSARQGCSNFCDPFSSEDLFAPSPSTSCPSREQVSLRPYEPWRRPDAQNTRWRT